LKGGEVVPERAKYGLTEESLLKRKSGVVRVKEGKQQKGREKENST